VVKVETLIEQTEFLLEKQKEAQKECVEIFNGLLKVVEKKRQQVKDEEEVAALDQVRDLISNQVEAISEETQVDIDFLAEQLDALKNIQKIKDPAKMKEMLALLIDEEEEIKETSAFKKDVAEEASVSRQNLLTLVTDLKDAITEGSAKDVALYLESILEAEEGEAGEDEDDACCDECWEDDNDSKKSCGSSCSDCKACPGARKMTIEDVFTEFNKQSEKNSGKKTRH
jgi:hypothetical protein